MPPHVTFVMGPPGSGKSTHAQKLHDFRNAEVVSTDDFREGKTDNYGHLLAGSYKKLNAALAEGRDCVFDNPGANPAVRKAVRNIARKHGATVSAVVLQTPLGDCFRAQEERDHPVPYEDVARLHEAVERQIGRLQNEGFDRVVIVDRRAK